jgi:hypothetical protein
MTLQQHQGNKQCKCGFKTYYLRRLLNRCPHALASGSAAILQEAVIANRLLLLRNLPADAPVPETLWGYYTPWGFCPVHITTRLSTAVGGRGEVKVGSCQFNFGTEEEEQVHNLGVESKKKKKKKTDFVSQVK